MGNSHKAQGLATREVMAEVGSPPEPRGCEQGVTGGVGKWNKEEAVAFAAELLLTSQTLFASVGSLPLCIPNNLFLCLLAYI